MNQPYLAMTSYCRLHHLKWLLSVAKSTATNNGERTGTHFSNLNILTVRNTNQSKRCFTSLQRHCEHSVESKVCYEKGITQMCTTLNRLCQTRNGHDRLPAAGKHTSSLFVSDASAQNTTMVEIDLGLERSVARKKQLVKNIKIRGMKTDVDTFIEDFRLMKRLEKEKQRLEREREEIAKKMADLKKSKDKEEDVLDTRELLTSRGKRVKEALKELQRSWWVWEERVMLAGLGLPNNIRAQTPEEEVLVLESHGEIPDMSEARSHLEVVREKDLVRFSCVGPKAYYLLGQLASHEQSLLHSVSHHLTNNHFHQLACPEIFRSLVAEGCGIDYKDKTQIFSLLDKDDRDATGNLRLDDFLHIQGTSLLSFAGYLAKTVVQTSCLPYRQVAVGRQYLPESEPDLPGLFGVTQSMKTVVLSSCSDRVSCVMEFNKITALVWKMYHKLNLAMRLVVIPGRDLLLCESLRVEIQMWAPSVRTYIKVAHVSCIDDYVARRLMCYHSNNQTDYKQFQHLQMVYGEVLDVTRLLGVMLEHRPSSSDKNVLTLPDFEFSIQELRSTSEECILSLQELLFTPEHIVS
ncbi:serine--tRNA synthetase-like protein Slimp [Haliotis rufescens]|uniref:serine--tRNA synthetase-like protein Slimp n=1 Tax=Haliotis rufescens TaxID=6454 RepID=UPI00201EBBDC|nr:serine--tRNA synthetase-like protein Slimp [Haliotis rufescens]XP_048245402.1 serine--tRNA synthetase-like protein Slimp [Haliotis rufescens]XP_048245403.1 serine--tRNA synthetase-like protein Slimp [Haliotis rufescens]XP_048245404.1 serine--tRNA synthetase-like protein Slimp [Haliotis rufescens]